MHFRIILDELFRGKLVFFSYFDCENKDILTTIEPPLFSQKRYFFSLAEHFLCDEISFNLLIHIFLCFYRRNKFQYFLHITIQVKSTIGQIKLKYNVCCNYSCSTIRPNQTQKNSPSPNQPEPSRLNPNQPNPTRPSSPQSGQTRPDQACSTQKKIQGICDEKKSALIK